MAKSLKSLLSKINLVDLAVVLVLVAVLMCLFQKMNVVEGLCVRNESVLSNLYQYNCSRRGDCYAGGDYDSWRNLCMSIPDENCENVSASSQHALTPVNNPSELISGCRVATEDEDLAREISQGPCGLTPPQVALIQSAMIGHNESCSYDDVTLGRILSAEHIPQH